MIPSEEMTGCRYRRPVPKDPLIVVKKIPAQIMAKRAFLMYLLFEKMM